MCSGEATSSYTFTMAIKAKIEIERKRETLPLGKHIRIFGLVFHTVKEVIQIHSAFPHMDNTDKHTYLI